MLKLFFVVLLIIHGLIHLMGFVKSFGFAKIEQLNSFISKSFGLIWLITALIFLFAAVLFLFGDKRWLFLGLVSIIFSQTLIFFYWEDAKFGTIPNVLILIMVVVGFALWHFDLKIDRETDKVLSKQIQSNKIIIDEKIKKLPEAIQKWVRNSGIIGKKMVNTVFLKQRGYMRLKPEQKKWIKTEALQYFSINQPAFIWKVKMTVLGLPIVGRDLFMDGKGGMLIKIAGIIPVVNIMNNKKIDISTIQRYLGEIVWFPSAVISSYIKWEEVDKHIVKGTMRYGDNRGSAFFHFNEKWEITKVIAYRYKEIEDKQPKKWVAEVKKTEKINGVKIPIELEVSWILKNKKFTWYKFKIYDVIYNKNK